MSRNSIWLGASLLLLAIAVSLLASPGSAVAQAEATATPAGTATATPAPTATPDLTYAQSISTLEELPTGSDSETARVYYDSLFAFYYDQMPDNRATEIWWAMPRDVFMWLGIMLLVFFLYAYVFLSTHRGEGDLHETTSFAGSILERGGKVSAFTWVIIAMLFGLALFYVVWNIRDGYLY